MKRTFISLFTIAVLFTAHISYAQLVPPQMSYTFFSTGTDTDYSGTAHISQDFPAGVTYAGYFDHLNNDKAYVESTISMIDRLGFSGVYEIQDSRTDAMKQLAGVGYTRSVGAWNFYGKFFPFTTDDDHHFAGEIAAMTSVGDWNFNGFVDVAHGDVTEWFSKSQAVRELVPHVSFAGEYRWQRQFHHIDRSIWFGLLLGM